MTTAIQVKGISSPKIFHREYENDLPKQSETRNKVFSQFLRVTQAALPFLTLYKPFGQPMAIALGSTRAITSIAQMTNAISSRDSKAIGKTALEVAIACTALVCSILAHPLGMLVTTSHDMIKNVTQLAQAIQEKDYKKAAEIGLHLANNVLYFSCFFAGSFELAIASIGFQAFLGLYNSCNEFKKGNYLEGCAHLLMAGIRGKQVNTHIECKKAANQILSEAPSQEAENVSKTASNVSQNTAVETYKVAIRILDGFHFHVADYSNGIRVVSCLDGDMRGCQIVIKNSVQVAESWNVLWYSNYFVHRYIDAYIYSYANRQRIEY